MKKVAVTGGLACGKTSVCHFFEKLGAFIVSADTVVHHLLLTDASLQDRVVSLLGSEVKAGGAIDRQEVARQVFADSEKLTQLEKMIHPAVHKELQARYAHACKTTESPLFVAEVPLLFEVGMEDDFDCTVAVTSRANRYAGSDYEERAARQLAQDQKAARADYVIRNDGSLDELKDEVHKLFNTLIN